LGERDKELTKHKGILSITVGKLMDIQAVKYPDNDALVYVDRGLRLTYRQFNKVCRTAAKAVPHRDHEAGGRPHGREGKIARYKIPRYVQFVDEFPMTASGKIQKYKLREMAIEILGLQKAASIETA